MIGKCLGLSDILEVVGVIMVIGKGWRNSGDWEVGGILYVIKLGVVIVMIGGCDECGSKWCTGSGWVNMVIESWVGQYGCWEVGCQ